MVQVHRKNGGGAPPPPRPGIGADVSIKPLINNIKQKIVKRAGNDGLHALSRLLRIFDVDGNGKLSRAELRDGLRESGVDLTAAQGDQVFAYFDKDRSGYVTVDELMRGMRDGLNPARQALVDEAYKRLDKSGDGMVTLEDLKMAYDVSLQDSCEWGSQMGSKSFSA